MHHRGTQRLETGRLILRRFKVEDAQAMYDNWASDPEVTRYLTWPTHASVDVTRELLEEWVRRYECADNYNWAIALRDAPDMPIGSISAVRMNERAGTAEVGYCIGRAWWRRGITSEALSAVIAFLFDQVGANKVAARHDARNPNSGRVMLKCGMKYEGTLRQSDVNNQGVGDMCYYGLLSCERQGR